MLKSTTCGNETNKRKYMYKSILYYKLWHLLLSLPYLTVQRTVTDYLKLKKALHDLCQNYRSRGRYEILVMQLVIYDCTSLNYF